MDYRSVITARYEMRRQRNPEYSMRAFARDLNISPSRLCEILAGKGNLSWMKGQVIAERLGLSRSETDHFLSMIELTSATVKQARQILLVDGESIDRGAASDKVKFESRNTFFESTSLPEVEDKIARFQRSLTTDFSHESTEAVYEVSILLVKRTKALRN